LQHGTRLGKVEPVFPRADKSAIERMQQMEQQRTTTQAAMTPATAGPPVTPATAAPTAPAPAAIADGRISIDDFAKVEMRVGQVKVAEKVKAPTSCCAWKSTSARRSGK